MKITIIGTGNVAFHLGKILKEKGQTVAQIVGRNAEKTAWLASVLETDFTTNFSEINLESDLYIIAVSDDAIAEIAEKLAQVLDNQLVVHTSGSIPSIVLQPYFKNFGTLYPLQTFSVNSKPDFSEIPIFVNATPQYNTVFLEKIARILSPKVHELADEKRVVLHVAAVFVNNFANHLFAIADEISTLENLPFDVLKPLIRETIRKIENNNPSEVQTGPAKRGDQITIQKHLDFLKKQTPQYLGVYEVLSDSILKKFTK